MHGEDVSAAIRISERNRDRHFAAQRGIRRLEFAHFDDLLVRHELHEATVIRVGVRRCLTVPAGSS